jgi:hypothetical protein
VPNPPEDDPRREHAWQPPGSPWGAESERFPDPLDTPHRAPRPVSADYHPAHHPVHYAGAYPADARPQPKRRHWLRWLLIGLAVLIVGGCLAAVLNGTQPATTSATPAASSATAGSSPAALGKPITEGQLTWTVVKVSYPAGKVGDQAARGRWAVVTITAKNVGDSPQTFYDDQTEGWVGGKRYSPDSGAQFGLDVAAGGTQRQNEIGPGTTVRVLVPFDIPKGAKLTRLVLHENPASPGVEVQAHS